LLVKIKQKTLHYPRHAELVSAPHQSGHLYNGFLKQVQDDLFYFKTYEVLKTS